MEELKPTLSYNEWQRISIQREVKLLCQKFDYKFSQGKLDELLEIYKNETEGVYEFCCLVMYANIMPWSHDGVKLDLISAKLNSECPCKLGSDVLLYLYTQIADEVGWNEILIHCYNKALKYTLPF